MRSEHWCKWLILSFTLLLWNIHMRGLYPYWYSIKDCKKIRFCLKFIKFDRHALTDSLFPLFYTKRICNWWNSAFSQYLNLTISPYYFPKVFRFLYEPKQSHFYIQKRAIDTYLGLVSCYYFQANLCSNLFI